MYMIGVQIYYTVYDRSTIVLYAVAVAKYAVAVAVAEYAVWYTGLCCVVCRTIWYGTQYGTQYYAAMYVAASALALASEVSNC